MTITINIENVHIHINASDLSLLNNKQDLDPGVDEVEVKLIKPKKLKDNMVIREPKNENSVRIEEKKPIPTEELIQKEEELKEIVRYNKNWDVTDEFKILVVKFYDDTMWSVGKVAKHYWVDELDLKHWIKVFWIKEEDSIL